MRKKTDTVSVVSNKIITKSAKRIASSTHDKTTKHMTTGKEQAVCTMSSSPSPEGEVLGTNGHGVGHSRDEMCDDMGSDNGSRGRSITPTESDLLKYLTAHITNPVVDGLTSFVISREEYLKGIVDLVKSDCPEVVHDMECFIGAMQTAFRDSNPNAHAP